MHTDEIERLIAPVLGHLRQHDPGGVVGVYLYGSAAETGLRPNSDIDLLVLTQRSLTGSQRTTLTSILLETSGWKGHAARFPAVAHRRPIDLTSLVVNEVQPLTAAPQRDFQFGEWLREQVLAGTALMPTQDPDVVVLLATALHSNRTLQGPGIETLIDPVPAGLLRQALRANVPELANNLVGDERNTVLTLARTLVTSETGQILNKDAAASRIAFRLPEDQADLLSRARQEYLGGHSVDWNASATQVRDLAASLLRLVDAATGPDPHR